MRKPLLRSVWYKVAAIVLLAILGVAWLGWDPDSRSDDVYVCVMPYEEFQYYEHHLVPYHAGMTLRDVVESAATRRRLPEVKESEMEAFIDRRIPWSWLGACKRVLEGCTYFAQTFGLTGLDEKIQTFRAENFYHNPHVYRVDSAHSSWDSEVFPSDFIRVDKREDLPRSWSSSFDILNAREIL